MPSSFSGNTPKLPAVSYLSELPSKFKSMCKQLDSYGFYLNSEIEFIDKAEALK